MSIFIHHASANFMLGGEEKQKKEIYAEMLPVCLR